MDGGAQEASTAAERDNKLSVCAIIGQILPSDANLECLNAITRHQLGQLHRLAYLVSRERCYL